METFSCNTCHRHDSETKITLKAVHDGTNLYVLATWPDQTASFTRNGWVYTQAPTVSGAEAGSWSKVEGQSEDRIAFFFPIGGITGDSFTTGGCMTKCHTSDSTGQDEMEDEVFLKSGKADMWHLKAARSLPAGSADGSGLTIDESTHEVTAGTVTMVGWMDDKWVGQWSADNSPDGGRYGDAGTSAYRHNRTADKSKPLYMEKAPTDFMDAMVLTQDEIDAGEVVGDETNGVSDADAATYWPAYEALNAVVPERILTAPSGSRADLEAAAKWADGTWTVEIKRPLNTGNDDDVQFVEGQEYVFGVAIMDNSGGGKHRPSEKYVLKIEK